MLAMAPTHQTTYGWKRFWFPRAAEVDLSDGGFLSDPDGPSGRFVNRVGATLAALCEHRCLVLLGEPGIGKSRAQETERPSIDAAVGERGDHTHWVDFKAVGDQSNLPRRLLDHPTITAWIKGDHRLHLFLDSVDEGLVHIKRLTDVLLGEFKEWPLDRLFLRVACRMSEWPAAFEDGLKALFLASGADPKHPVHACELAPLRRIDVAHAAQADQVDPRAFLQEVERLGVVPFAGKPITLRFLLDLYRADRALPQTQTELYRRGCLILCEDPDGPVRPLDPVQRMAVAGRIGAGLLFAKRAAVWTGPDWGDVPKEDVTLADLRGGEEVVAGDAFPVDRTALEDTLQTGLFTLRGPDRLQWAHLSYGEFLAAWYVSERKMGLGQVMSLLAHPDDPHGKLVPQLFETAAWLASMRQDVFREILRREPEVLLRSDAAAADSTDRAALVDALLDLYGGDGRRPWGFDARRPRYDGLAHPGLADQIRRYLRDGSRGEEARAFAIDLADACQVQEVQGELADLALASAEPLDLRVSAAHVVARHGDAQTRTRLLPLVTGSLPEDELDQLKGCALSAVWPNNLTASALFASLTPPRRADVLSTYQVFLYNLAEGLKTGDLPLALRWVREQERHPRRGARTDAFQRLADDIVTRAWDALSHPAVASEFARLAVRRLGRSEPLLSYPNGGWGSGSSDTPASDPTKRHAAVEAVLPLLTDQQWTWLVYSRPRLVTPDDFSWLLAQRLRHSEQVTRRLLARLAVGMLDWASAAQIDQALEAAESDAELRTALDPFVRTIDLDSDEARREKQAYEQRTQVAAKRPNDAISPPPRERVEFYLGLSERGKHWAWWQLARELTLGPESTHYDQELEPDVTRLAGWDALDEPTRLRVIEAAKRYLPDGDPETDKWFGSNDIYLPALAGYKALLLVEAQEPGQGEVLPAAVWAKWAPVVLTYPSADNTPDRARHRQLVRLTYEHAPEQVLDVLARMPRGEAGGHGVLAAVDALEEHCWDDRLAEAVLALAGDSSSTKPWTVGHLLGHLLSHGHAGARALAQSLVSARSGGHGDGRERAVEAARALYLHADSASWSDLWAVFQEDPAFGRDVVERLASRMEHNSASGPLLSEEQLADLYCWAIEQYPHSEDPDHHGEMVTLGDRDFAARWRDAVLLRLRQAGTPAAVDAIRRIAAGHPELEWLRLVVAESEVVARQRAWRAPAVRDVIGLAQRPERRLVQNGSQLLDVLQEALARFEQDLHGETPLVPYLWDEQKDGYWRPKDENYLSDLVKICLDRELRRSGIFVGREVEIRRRVAPDTLGGAPGEEIDLLIRAFVRGPHREVTDAVTVIVETKGCWHTELRRALKEQLVDRYLKHNAARHGLYLVGWYPCSQWDPHHSACGNTPRMTLAEARHLFAEQAAAQSVGGLDVRAVVLDTALR